MPFNVHRVFSRKRTPSPDELEPPCEHIGSVTQLPEPSTHECAECVEAGDTWVHLRLCLECGYVGCCDSSPNRHTTAHHDATGHGLIRGIEPGERWVYCYEDLETSSL
jgi:uncharacterized UBP type Zn finger protein